MAASMSNVEIQEKIQNKGRGLIATRCIDKDVLLFEESPLVSCQFSWNRLYKYRACDYCMASLETAQQMATRLSGITDLILPHPECCEVKTDEHCRCDACGVDYCSVVCKEKASDKYHKCLCVGQLEADPGHPLVKLEEAWRNIHYPPETASVMILARMVATVLQSEDKTQVMQQLSEFCSATNHQEEELAHKLLGTQFKDQIELLQGHATKALFSEHVEQWFTPEGFTSLIALLGTNGQGIGTSSLSVYVHNCDALDLCEKDRKELDAFIDTLYTTMADVSGEFLNCEGSGLYLLQSACNHSCSPNAEVTFPHNNHVLAMRALRDIKEGEEITISYLDECELQRSRHSRQKYLRENYIFHCLCERCIAQADDPEVTSDEGSDMEFEEP